MRWKVTSGCISPTSMPRRRSLRGRDGTSDGAELGEAFGLGKVESLATSKSANGESQEASTDTRADAGASMATLIIGPGIVRFTPIIPTQSAANAAHARGIRAKSSRQPATKAGAPSSPRRAAAAGWRAAEAVRISPRHAGGIGRSGWRRRRFSNCSSLFI